MIIGIPVYEGVNLLDVAGPLEMFGWVNREKQPDEPSLDPLLLSWDGNEVTSQNQVTFKVDKSFDGAPPLDILWVPGGNPAALARMMAGPGPDYPAYLDYIRAAAANAAWVCSVCEGAMLLAQAGLLDGHQATTHWAFVDCLAMYPAIIVDPTNPRFVVSGNRLTGGGISSGLDESLKLIELVTSTATATAVQIVTQYLPKPPVNGALPTVPPPCLPVVAAAIRPGGP